MPQRRSAIKIGDLGGIHTASAKLRRSQAERNKFAKDPVKYLAGIGIAVPAKFQDILKVNASRIDSVFKGKHDWVAAIAVA